MDYRPLGRTDIKVSSVCLGTMTWGEQNTEAEGHAQMDYAFERGVNFLDTAELYAIPPKRETAGTTETIIGTWLKAKGNRDKVILASKVVGRTGMDWFREGQPAVLDRANIEAAIDGSLKRLQTDYIDLYQVHWPDRPRSAFGSNPTVYEWIDGESVPIEETLEALTDLVKTGKVRHIGLSNESSWGTMRYVTTAEAKGLARVQSIQNAYSLVNRTFEVGLAEIAHREQVGLLAYSPLGQGYLTGKYRDGARPKGSRLELFDRLERYRGPGTHEAYEGYFKIAAVHGISPATLALKFVESRSFVTSNIIGATKMDQLKENIDAHELTWTEELENAVNAVHQVHQNPCP
ncbi:MAG: aldo/keto reductase [Pseudomonadota bacterium]